MSLLFSMLTVCVFLLVSEKIAHWFVIPVLVCGVLIGSDAVDWLCGRLSLFDPVGVVGVLGIHFFFLAPLLHVVWDSWMTLVEPPSDWRDWLGGMAIINAVGLVLYRVARQRAASWGKQAGKETSWRLNSKRLLLTTGCGLVLSAALQIWFYGQHGGIIGYIDEFSRSIGTAEADSSFRDTAWIFMVSERFPILAMFFFALSARHSRIARSWLVVTLVFAAFFALQLLFGGLRGSRGTTIWAIFWATGIIHFWVRPLTRKFLFAGAALVIVFMYVYGFYKEVGSDTWATLQDSQQTSQLSEKTGRTFGDMLLGDFARADVQAFLLYRLCKPNRDYKYAWGKTYLGSVALLVPRALWANRPPTKAKEGTEAQFGVGSWDEYTWNSSKVYGLAGETMLNFGPIAVPLAYLIFGLIVGRLQHFLSRLDPEDTRLLLYPFLVNICVTVLTTDSDNLLFNLVKNGLVPAVVVWFGSHLLIHIPELRKSGIRRTTPITT
jgi:hypothetical protein